MSTSTVNGASYLVLRACREYARSENIHITEALAKAIRLRYDGLSDTEIITVLSTKPNGDGGDGSD